MCSPCSANSYSLNFLDGCVQGNCGIRSCTRCPVGVECQIGTEQPWLHFVPKLLKVGTRSISSSLLKGLSKDHHVGLNRSYVIIYNNLTGDSKALETQDTDAPSYVWEFVIECKGEEACDPDQVPAFYLRKCPPGTQLINKTIGSSKFDATAQQCVPCGPLNYIVDPNSGGRCQECPKVRCFVCNCFLFHAEETLREAHKMIFLLHEELGDVSLTTLI